MLIVNASKSKAVIVVNASQSKWDGFLFTGMQKKNQKEPKRTEKNQKECRKKRKKHEMQTKKT
jgi:hypothetical protein